MLPNNYSLASAHCTLHNDKWYKFKIYLKNREVRYKCFTDNTSAFKDWSKKSHIQFN